MSRLLIVGKHDNDPVVSTLQDAARGVREVKGIEFEQTPGELRPNDWLLVCFVPSHNEVRALLDLIKKAEGSKDRKVILYARNELLPPDDVMEYCVEFDVAWVFSQWEQQHHRGNDLEKTHWPIDGLKFAG